MFLSTPIVGFCKLIISSKHIQMLLHKNIQRLSEAAGTLEVWKTQV